MNCFVIIGMHRSCTSMISRSLHESGEVFMGESMLGKTRYQPDGHYEDRLFLSINEDILKACGGSWRNPPSETRIKEVEHDFSDRIKEAILKAESNAKKRGAKSWGFKDPRTCITYPVYQPYLKNPSLIFTSRNSDDIAKSLSKRDGMSISEAKSLCSEYNRRILSIFEKSQFNV